MLGTCQATQMSSYRWVAWKFKRFFKVRVDYTDMNGIFCAKEISSAGPEPASCLASSLHAAYKVVMRTFLQTLLKMSIVAALLMWLSHSDKLDFRHLRVLIDDPAIFAANLAMWSLGYVGLGTLRWWLLLRGLDLHVSFPRALHLQLIGFFFNTTMPGAVGGDIVKAVYLIRDQSQSQGKTRAMLTVLLDRAVGLAALFVMAGSAIMYNSSFFLERPPMIPLIVFIGAGLAAILGGFAVVMFPFKPGKDPFKRFLNLGWPGFSTVEKIYDALRAYREKPLILMATVGISVVIQSSAVLYALFLTQRLTGQRPEFSVFGTIFPIGTMTTALPLAPGGLGLGHLAFEKLFTMVGLTGGANIFNIMALGQLCLNLLGFIPYLFYRSSMGSLKAMQDKLSGESEASTVT